MDTTKKNELLAKQRAVYRQKHEGASLSSTKESDVLAKQRSRHWQKRESKSSCSLGLDGAIEVVAGMHRLLFDVVWFITFFVFVIVGYWSLQY